MKGDKRPQNREQLYQISEVAKVCGVSRSTIMRMEEKGLITPYYVSKDSGRRYYDCYDVAKINHIEHLKDMGLTKEEIYTYYASREGERETLRHLEERLSHLQRSVEELRLRIQRTNALNIQLMDVPAEVCMIKKGVGLNAADMVETMLEAYHDCLKRGIEFARHSIFTQLECDDYLRGIVTTTPYPYTVCVPINPAKAPEDAVRFPACKALSVIYYGAYDRNREVWLRLGEELHVRGLTPVSWPRAIAVVGPYVGREIESDRWCTRMLVPIACNESGPD